MKYLLLIIGLFVAVPSFSQATEITPQVQKKIKQDIEKEIPKLRQHLISKKETPVRIEFITDTFRLEQFVIKWIDLDNTDFGMKEAAYEVARLYDSLMNKYYKKLLATLKGKDKNILIQAQKAWIAFRDSETTLVETISKDDYAGGGTMQRLTEASKYLSLIKNRTIALFHHYLRASQNE